MDIVINECCIPDSTIAVVRLGTLSLVVGRAMDGPMPPAEISFANSRDHSGAARRQLLRH